jgi:hypothetical protein
MSRARDVSQIISIVNAKGDLVVGTADNAVARQAVGADGLALIADSTQATGVTWATAGGFNEVLMLMGV